MARWSLHQRHLGHARTCSEEGRNRGRRQAQKQIHILNGWNVIYQGKSILVTAQPYIPIKGYQFVGMDGVCAKFIYIAYGNTNRFFRTLEMGRLP